MSTKTIASYSLDFKISTTILSGYYPCTQTIYQNSEYKACTHAKVNY